MGMQNSKYLVSGYSFENNVVDIQNQNNGSANSIIFTDNLIGRSANFNGINSYVNLGSANLPLIRNANISFSFWIYKIGTTTGTIFAKCESNLIATTQYRAFFINNTIQIQTGGIGDLGTTTYFAANFIETWNHVTILIPNAASGLRLFINTIEIPKLTGTGQIGTYNTAYPLILGARNNGSMTSFALYNSMILNNFKIYNKILTQSDIQRDYLNLPIL